jgi:GntR family transcriptional regulator, transcriptional repressor for pyruvate dehydrogenase complex
VGICTHEVLAAANPNALLRFMCQVIDRLLRHMVAMGGRANHPSFRKLGDANVAAHRRLLAAARRGDAARVRQLMVKHIDKAECHLRRLDAEVRRRFAFDSELRPSIAPQPRRTRKENAR